MTVLFVFLLLYLLHFTSRCFCHFCTLNTSASNTSVTNKLAHLHLPIHQHRQQPVTQFHQCLGFFLNILVFFKMGLTASENLVISSLFEYTDRNVYKTPMRIPLKVLPAEDLFCISLILTGTHVSLLIPVPP